MKEKKQSMELQPIGGKLRHARRLLGINLKEVAAKAGVTESYVSKLERDLIKPSLNSLHRICKALDTNIGAILAAADPSDEPVTVVRAGKRPVLSVNPRPNVDGITLEAIIPAFPGNLLQANIHTVKPGGGNHETITHQGQEFGYVLAGTIEVIVKDKPYRMETGDTFFFESHLPHTYRNPGPDEAKILWVNTPPTF